MAIMMALGMKGSTLVGILFVTIISWIPTCGNQAAWLGACSDTPGGEARLDNVSGFLTRLLSSGQASLRA